MRRMTFGATLALGSLATSACFAQVLPEPAWPPPGSTGAVQEIVGSSSASPAWSAPAVRRVWYGGQTLIVLAASAAVTAAGGWTPVSILGAGGILLGGPVVHWAHGHVGRGFGSLALNVGLPLLTGAVGLGIAEGWGVLFTAPVGLLAALVIDIAVLSYEDRPATSARRRGPSLAPDVRFSSDGVAVGAVGVF